jgi:serine/threonine protein kinase
LPFDDDNIRLLLLKVKAGVFEMPNEVQGPARDLLSRMLEKEPEKRITVRPTLFRPCLMRRDAH